MTAIVPEGMSCVNAFHALWTNSKPAAFFSMNGIDPTAQEEEVSTARKVAELFETSTYFDYEGGRLLKTDFSEFPKLKVHTYDKDYGGGAAQKVLDEYNKRASDERFDRNDFYKFSELVKS